MSAVWVLNNRKANGDLILHGAFDNPEEAFDFKQEIEQSPEEWNFESGDNLSVTSMWMGARYREPASCPEISWS